MKLKVAPALLRVAPGKVGFAPVDERSRDKLRREFEPLRKLYSTAAWRAARLETFVRDGFACKICGRLEADSGRLVCDHVKAHRGNVALFWDSANLQTLCKRCHDSFKQRHEKSEG